MQICRGTNYEVMFQKHSMNILKHINFVYWSGRCRMLVDIGSDVCTNPSCSFGAMSSSNIITNFDFWVDVSDHTGTLPSCNLVGNTAEKTLGYTVSI